jgi:hypothetical protein
MARSPASVFSSSSAVIAARWEKTSATLTAEGKPVLFSSTWDEHQPKRWSW